MAALSPELTELVLHLAASGGFWDRRGETHGVWKRRTKALLKADGAPELVREAVAALAEGGSLHNRTDPNVDYDWLRPSPTRHLANGFALACGLLGGRGADPAATDALVEVLLTVARKSASVLDGYFVRDDDLSGAVFTALGDLAAVDALWTCTARSSPAPTVTPSSSGWSRGRRRVWDSCRSSWPNGPCPPAGWAPIGRFGSVRRPAERHG